MIKLRQLKPELGRLCASKKTKKELRRRLKAIKVIHGQFGPHLRAKWARMLAKRTSTSVPFVHRVERSSGDGIESSVVPLRVSHFS
jgi:hypothetical protein